MNGTAWQSLDLPMTIYQLRLYFVILLSALSDLNVNPSSSGSDPTLQRHSWPEVLVVFFLDSQLTPSHFAVGPLIHLLIQAAQPMHNQFSPSDTSPQGAAPILHVGR